MEVESFTNQGGWVVDQQSMDQVGYPYMLAHGLGAQVANAIFIKFSIAMNKHFAQSIG